jgi:hypothetical protein
LEARSDQQSMVIGFPASWICFGIFEQRFEFEIFESSEFGCHNCHNVCGACDRRFSRQTWGQRLSRF